MNIVNISDYIEKDWKLAEPVTPSPELVEKWKGFLDSESLAHQYTTYIHEWYEMAHAYMRSHMWIGDPVCYAPIKEDCLEASANIEYLYNTLRLNLDYTGYEDLHHDHHNEARNNHAKLRWILWNYRVKLTEYTLNEVEIIEKWIDIIKNCETLDADYFTDPNKHDQVNMCMGLNGEIKNFYRDLLFMCCSCNEGCDSHGDVYIDKRRKLPRKAKEFILEYLEKTRYILDEKPIFTDLID